jgi:uncharacterized protein (DUF58 family)
MERESLLDPKILVKFSNLYLVAKTVVEGFITGLHKSPYRGFSVEFSEHREYTPGEDLRYLDWKVFGRTDRFYIKVFKEETNLKCYIILDVSNSMNYKSGPVTKIEYGTLLSAVLSYLMIKQKDAVGLVIFDSDVKTFINPVSTTQHLHYLIQTLEKTRPGERKTSIGMVLNKVVQNIKKRSLIILISDLFDDPVTTMRGISHLRHKHHEVVVFHLLDPYETDLPFTGDCEFLDMETGEKLAANALSLKDSYRKNLQEFLDNIRKNCIENKVDYVKTITNNPFDYFLYNYLEKRYSIINS